MAKNDVVIKDLMAKVEEQKAKLGTKERNVWRTNGVFKYDFDKSNFFNLNTVSDPTVLAYALAYLLGKESNFRDACSRLGVKSDYMHDGYLVEDWEEDFKTRVRGIEYDKNKKKLEDTKKKLASLVSEEARTEMELESIKESLGL